MARACLVLFFVCFIFACDFASGYLTRGRNLQPVLAKDVPEVQDVIENKLSVETPPVDVTMNKKCAKIGEFCMNHSDCCTYSCLGYMKRCVS